MTKRDAFCGERKRRKERSSPVFPLGHTRATPLVCRVLLLLLLCVLSLPLGSFLHRRVLS